MKDKIKKIIKIIQIKNNNEKLDQILWEKNPIVKCYNGSNKN
jgi:hypothetical protein